MKFTLLFLSVAASALANMAHPHIKRDHNAHAAAALHKKDDADQLAKRDSYSGTATYYEVQTGNAGACGQMLYDSQFIVALNSPQLQAYGGYQNGKPASCGQSITISAFGQQQQATIMDECPTCGWGSLDLSPSLFSAFTSLDAGVFPMTWWFNDGSGGGGQSTPTTTAWTPPPSPTTSDYTPPPPPPPPPTTSSTSWTPPPPTTTTSTTSTTSTSTTSTSSSTSTSTSSSSSQDTVQDVPATSSPPNNLDNVNLAAVKMAAFMQAAAGL